MLYPMYAMVLLTFAVAVVMFRSRVRAVREGKVRMGYYKTFNGPQEIPDFALLPARHFTNLFEVPILFYAVCLAAMILEATGPAMTALAWVFVCARYAHAFIHLTYNKLYHRIAAFALGLFTVVAMWTLLVISRT